MSVLLIGNKIKVLRLLLLCTSSYLQEEIELQEHVQHKNGQPVMYETSNLAPEKLDGKRSETFSADETKVCFFVRIFVSRVSAESILASVIPSTLNFLRVPTFHWKKMKKKYDSLKLK